jgi:predicted unusual protein kinase regulating ubiquinone biosynthesis (AarF/ABC1/UbiB family)
VVIPEVIADMVRPRALVLEYLEGTRIDRLDRRIASGDVDRDAVLATLIEAYIKMMLQDGFFHADPHFGNLLVDAEGRLVLLDFGMVLRMERATQTQLVSTVLAASRQDVDGVINGFYELGILDPDVDRGTVRDAARHLLAVTLRGDASHAQIQRVVEDVLRTFYDWPLMLPAELVYFGRAAALVEGIGLRYDPDFNTIAVARPMVARAAAGLLHGERDPRAMIADWGLEAAQAFRTMRELLTRVERDELRVRWHQRDTVELYRTITQQVRRLVLAAGALSLAIMSSIIYAATRHLGILLGGCFVAAALFFLVLVLPGHLFQNPLRHRRRRPFRV